MPVDRTRRTMRLALLDALAGRSQLQFEDYLTQEDRSWLQEIIKKTRVGPLLHWRVMQQPKAIVPTEWMDLLGRLYKISALRNMMLLSEMYNIHILLSKEGITAVALKGAFLACHSYPAPALRPTRDLDLLIERKHIWQAYEILKNNGYQSLTGVYGEVVGDKDQFLNKNKHINRLFHPAKKVIIELHHLLYTDSVLDFARHNINGSYWDRLIYRKLQGVDIPYLSPTDILFHLIFHSFYDDKLTSGPLIFSDVYFLLAKEKIDWPLFWSLAASINWTSGAVLALEMTKHYYPDMQISYPETDCFVKIDVAEARTISALTLCDHTYKQIYHLSTLSSAHNFWEKIRLLKKKLFPPSFKRNQYSPSFFLGYYMYWKDIVGKVITSNLPTNWNDGLAEDVLLMNQLRGRLGNLSDSKGGSSDSMLRK